MPKTRKKPKKFKIELTPFSAVISGILLFGLLFYIFFLGILVGRGFFPEKFSTISDLKFQINKLQDLVGKKEEYKGIKSVDQEKDPELAFYEKLNSKKDEAKRANIPEKKEETPDEITLFKEPPEKRTTKEMPEKAITEVVEEKVTEQKETPTKTEEVKVKPPPSKDDMRQYTVQIGSFPEKERAEKLIKSLVDEGYDAYYYMAEVKGKDYYRVRVGRFADRKSALEYSGILEKETGHKGFVSTVGK